MRTKDIINICRQSLSRQKARTGLTVMGVTIGCCAIVLMLSIGIGSNEQTEVMLQSMGDLTLISVYNNYNGKDDQTLNKDTVAAMQEIPNVEVATPKLNDYNSSYNLTAGMNGRYSFDYPQITGMKEDAPQKLGYQLKEGTWLENSGMGVGRRPIPILVGEKFFYGFVDTKRPEGKNRRYFDGDNGMGGGYYGPMGNNQQGEEPVAKEDPFFDDINTKLNLEVTSGSMSDNPGTEAKPLRQELRIVGIIKEDYSRGYETSQGIIMDIRDLESIINKAAGSVPASKRKEIKYDNVSVKVNDIKNVKEVEEKIKAMGFETSSMESVRESITKSTKQRQIMLAGLGGISLFVAAIGIMNTMIMSITERTKEIGIMKALGCYVHDVRRIFLTEAGFIGFIGGVIGVIISLVISFIINVAGAIGLVGGNDMFIPATDEGMSFFQKLANIHLDWNTIYTSLTTPGNRTSLIPWWLILFGLAFSTIIGLVSGYYPANKAVKIPALEAIKHE